MTWFRVDDSLDFHPKVEAAGNTAMGLWVRAGAYSARMLTEGYVARAMIAKLGGKARDAQALVVAGLWVEVDGGYQFHQWEQANPSRQKVLADRAAAAERQRKARERAAAKAAERQSQDESRRDGDDVSRSDFGVSHGPPGPARPDPSYLLTLISRLAAGDVGPPPAEVIAGWQQIAGPGVDLEAESVAYLIRFGDRPARDERGAWLGWLRKAAERAAAAAPTDARPPLGCSACDGGWLGLADDLRPRPCPTCRPHLRPVETA